MSKDVKVFKDVMTVGELADLLQNVPRHVEVRVTDSAGFYNFARVFQYQRDTNKAGRAVYIGPRDV
jgi:hypothetical protein